MSDWYPNSRAEQLVMIRNWIDILSVTETRTKWGIPADKFTELGNRFAAAQALLQKAASEDARTPVVTEQCRESFKALEETARFFHRHYFLVPPLEQADLVFPGIHLVELVNIRPAGGKPLNPRSDHGVRIYYGITGKDLPYSLFTRRKKERFDFDGGRCGVLAPPKLRGNLHSTLPGNTGALSQQPPCLPGRNPH